MLQKMKTRLKEQKGLTLIELLAVIVILAIIAAIAIPAIGKLIDNTKKDAIISNAQQMESAAKTYISAERNFKIPGDITLDELINKGYLDEFDDPDTKQAYTNEQKQNSKVVVSKNTTTNNTEYKVVLKGERGIDTATKASAITRGEIK
ncbi:type IV pilus assembly protein PilA [Oikeobacillus pervagus]|uniref:Type IV pilus assembly protein PilA n=1 Tax=Oikeobacillus pervagus TaxID=1325931 RepID=A0AAJ1WIP2_9BACI|nr:prepilin-type N-terminal cleavage/methylation domain-containing protein [Oikeobacillus pervagus]MDQ0214543.1 type IV pilus assembly protein PilA [Oikeobacillus pervagus]